MLHFQVNDYLSLKLEDGRTVIYVRNKRFLQCKYLLLNIQVDEIKALDDIESIDEASERLDNSQEYSDLKTIEIPPETEFWGHCSNLQVWYENEYNTRLLHRNLAFPLLKRLCEVGDPLAKKVFKEEIVERFISGTLEVIIFLIEEDYLRYLSDEEIKFLFEELKSKNKMLYSFIKPMLMVKNYIGKNYSLIKIKALIDKFNLELDNGIFSNMTSDEHLLWLRINKVILLSSRIKKVKNNY